MPTERLPLTRTRRRFWWEPQWRWHLSRFSRTSLCGLLAFGLTLAAATAAEPPADPARAGIQTGEVADLIRNLDADGYATRRRAVERLRDMATAPEANAKLAEAIGRALLDERISAEARSQLLELRQSLPPVRPAAPDAVPAAEIERLLDELNSDSFATRGAALRRMEWLLENERVAARCFVPLKKRLAQPDLARAHRKQLLRLWAGVRGRWLSSNTEWELPDVEPQQWRRWIDDLCAPDDAVDDRWRREVAYRELRDLLAREKYSGEVQVALKQRLESDAGNPLATTAIERVLAWTRPAMVAEVWVEGQLVTIQHLLVDIPQIPPNAMRATHFDRIDDHEAHCVSGNNLTPGDYPVGVAIPHPRGDNMMFHLINLPTPRRRLAYKYQSHRPAAERLREFSQRTTAALSSEKRRLTQPELSMLRQLEPHSVSTFVGRYLELFGDELLADKPTEDDDNPFGAEKHSEYHFLCELLADGGTHEAIAGLEHLAKREQPADNEEPSYHLAWIAALAIAERDPWPEVDAWLARVIANDTALLKSAELSAEVGATAAAQLLRRHEQSPRSFGIIELREQRVQGLVPCRFVAPTSRADVLAWWSREKQRG